MRAAITTAGAGAGNAGTAIGGTGHAVAGSDFIIDQYYNSGLDATDVIVAYNNE